MFHVKHSSPSLYGEFVEHVSTDEIKHEENHETEEFDGDEADDGMTEQKTDDERRNQVERFYGSGIHRYTLEQKETDGDDAANQEEDDARAAQFCRRQFRVSKVEDQRRPRHPRRDATDTSQESHEDGIAAAERELVMRELHEQQRDENDCADEQLQLICREMCENPEAEWLRNDVTDEYRPNQLVTGVLPNQKSLYDTGEKSYDKHHEHCLARIIENHKQWRCDDHKPEPRDALHERSQPNSQCGQQVCLPNSEIQNNHNLSTSKASDFFQRLLRCSTPTFLYQCFT